MLQLATTSRKFPSVRGNHPVKDQKFLHQKQKTAHCVQIDYVVLSPKLVIKRRISTEHSDSKSLEIRMLVLGHSLVRLLRTAQSSFRRSKCTKSLAIVRRNSGYSGRAKTKTKMIELISIFFVNRSFLEIFPFLTTFEGKKWIT